MTGITGFERRTLDANGVTLSAHVGGSGPTLVLLHGYPQNHMCWAKVAPTLAHNHRCIVPDLRGYGKSDAPADEAPYAGYSKRNMAADVAALMDAMGVPRASVIGHDRGARVAYRLALDTPEKVNQLVIVEVVPTGELWDRWNAELAYHAYHWTFLAQPAPLPERMISADPVAYIDWTLASWTLSKSLDPFAPAALASYREQAKDPTRVAAMCCDYRAGAGIDRRTDEEDMKAGRKIAAPMHFVWSEHGFPAQAGDPLGIWRRWCDRLTGEPISGCGHFVMEENPDEFLVKVERFLSVAR